MSSSSEYIVRGPGCSTAVGDIVAYRLDKLTGLIEGGSRWLDCGCADGGYCRGLLDRGATHVLGIDPESARIEQARVLHQAEARLRFDVGIAERIPAPESSFDAALINEVLEHVGDEHVTLAEVLRVLRPGGHLALFAPNRWFPFEGHGMRIGRHYIAAPTPVLPWLPRRFAARFMMARNYWPSELIRLCEEAGFETQRVEFAFPRFEIYRWLPVTMVEAYKRAVPRLERSPSLGRFGVSVLYVGRKPL